MAVSANAYGNFLVKALNKTINLASDALKVELLTSTYTPNLDTHTFQSDLTNEVSGTGYTAGGAALGSPAVTYTAANSWATQRANTTAYALGYIVRPVTGNGFVYQAITAGTSGGSIPTYPTTFGGTVADGTVVWMCVGRGVISFTGANVSWASSTITARYAAIYDSTPGSAATNPLVALVNFGSDVVSSGGTFQISWDANGILNIPTQ
jgi:hypothetical protein